MRLFALALLAPIAMCDVNLLRSDIRVGDQPECINYAFKQGKSGQTEMVCTQWADGKSNPVFKPIVTDSVLPWPSTERK